jgi:hypothetical protein
VVNAPHLEQHLTDPWAAESAAISGSISLPGSRTSANAARDADLRPKPGSFERHFSSSSIWRKAKFRRTG